jgi:hypothetical protein
MLRWTISFVINRLFLLALVLYAAKTWGPTSCQGGDAVVEWLSHNSPFEAINRALR